MRKVKILLIDSGIDISMIDLNVRITEIPINVKDDFVDARGHGTWCTETISRINNNISISSINIYRNDGEMDIASITNMIKEIGKDFDIINMSFASKEYSNETYEELNKVVDYLYDSGVKIFASSYGKNYEKSIPALCRNVYEVRGVDFLERNEYSVDIDHIDRKIIYASSENIFSRKNTMNCFSGNSKACAIMSGVASKIISEFGSQKGIFEEKLLEGSISREIFESRQINKYSFDLSKTHTATDEIRSLVDIISLACDLNSQQKRSLFDYDLLCTCTGINLDMLDYIVDAINESDIYPSINIEEMYESDFKNVYRLMEYIKVRGRKLYEYKKSTFKFFG